MKVSVIIPAYNDELYIKQCLDSVLGQTYHDIEIICIDDASTDGTTDIIKETMSRDSRVKLIHNESNMGGYTARKRGVEASTGEFILFVDADDAVDRNLISEVVGLAGGKDYDIIHFNTEIIDCGADRTHMDDMKDFVKPYLGILQGEEVFKKCFLDKEYGFNIWNKLFRTSLCKEVLVACEDMSIPKANDLFIYYLLSSNAHSYIGVDTKARYQYYLGRGNTDEKKISAEEYKRYCHYREMLQYLSAKKDLRVSYSAQIEAIRLLTKRLVDEAIEVLLFSVRKDERPKAMGFLFDAWRPEDIVTEIHDIYYLFSDEIVSYLRDVERFNIVNGAESKNIAFFYHKFGKGGVERVVSLLIPLYIEAGFNVTLITEEEPREDDFYIPIGVKRYTIPDWWPIAEGELSYRERAEKLINILRTEGVDTVCYHAASHPLLLYDLLAVKLYGAKFVLSKHELYSQHFSFNQDLLTNEIKVYPLVDTLVVLSHEEADLWRALGVHSEYIPNPLNPLIDRTIEYNGRSKDIIWVGRLDRNQKQYQYIVPIMQEVIKSIPDAVIRVYGSPETYKDAGYFYQQIKDAGISDNVIYKGYVTDVSEIYKDAAVMLVTSAYESYPMNILESKQYGIPLVNFDMPYLEMLKGNKGNVPVKQGSVPEAADAIVAVLGDEEYRCRLSKEAKDSIDNKINEIIVSKWKTLFNGKNQYSKPQENEYGQIIRTIAFHHSLGCAKHRELAGMYFRKRERLRPLELKEIISNRGLKLALYPYGKMGEELYEELKESGLDIDLFVDNKRKEETINIVTLDQLKKMDYMDYLFIICSNKKELYNEIREAITCFVPEENIYDWYPPEEP